MDRPLLQNAKSEIADKKRNSLRKKAWFSLGLWQHPRLRKDWTTLHDEDDQHVQSLNAFFDTMFAFAISHLGFSVRAGQDLASMLHWGQRFGIYLSLWLSTVDYSSRFDNDDVPHKAFWSLYGIGALGMMIHGTGGSQSPNSCILSLCMGYLYTLLALHYYRNAFHLPSCRIFCVIRGSVHLCCSILAIVAYGNLGIQELVFWLLTCAYPISLAILFAGREVRFRIWYKHLAREDAMKLLDPPYHIEFHIGRLSSFTMMVLGQLALATAIHPEEGFANPKGLYSSVVFAFVVLLSMKLFLFDVDYYETEDHALSRSWIRGIIWRMLFPFGVAGIANLGTGVALLIGVVGKSQPPVDEDFARGIACFSLSVFLLVGAIQKKLHRVPYTKLMEDSGHDGQAQILKM